jgi:gamma-glutamylcyclotransferase (GGCT)/AIG2-like uncharacterized protein YtfP
MAEARPELPFFFFGTLMDADVLARVTARPVVPAEMREAWLWGYRRHAARNAPYPVLRPHAACHVKGWVFHPRSADERARIDHFESEEYAPEVLRVQEGTRMVAALCYLDLDDVFDVLEEDWSLHHFQTVEKPHYLEACDGWMADYAALA